MIAETPVVRDIADGVTLTPPQAEILALGLLDGPAVISMPTGGGKTWLALRRARAVLDADARARAVFLVPLRLQADELYGRWRDAFAPHAVGVFHGGYGAPGQSAPPVPLARARLLIGTYEWFDACTRAWQTHIAWLAQVRLVVADEMHMLGDPTRGPALEGGLSRLTRLNPDVDVLPMSATAGNLDEIAFWLSNLLPRRPAARAYRSTWRRFPLEWSIRRVERAKDKPALLAEDVAPVVALGGRGLVFVQSRARAAAVAAALAKAGFRAGFHHAGRSRAARQQAEGDFRMGATQVLVATGTVGMGVDLPQIRKVIIYDAQRWGSGGWKPLGLNELRQLGGRGARDGAGEVVVYIAAWQPTPDLAAPDEAILSALGDARHLAAQLVVEVASHLATTPEQLARVFARSLSATQRRLPDVRQAIDTMLAAGMLAETRDGDGPARLVATRLGSIAVRHFLAPETVLMLSRTLAADDALNYTFLDLLLLAALHVEPRLTVDFEELEQLGAALRTERSTLLAAGLSDLLGRLDLPPSTLLSTIKSALVVRAWTRLGSAAAVADELDCIESDADRVVEATHRVLLAMAAIAAVEENSEPCVSPAETSSLTERLKALARMVAAGLDSGPATLTLIEGIGPIMARRLMEAAVDGVAIADVETLALAEPSDLAEVEQLSAARAERWIARAQALIAAGVSARRYEEFDAPRASIAENTSAQRPRAGDYRLLRALQLQVHADGERYVVSGGSEPRVVRFAGSGWRCDCPDETAPGGLCKHILAVRMHRGDAELRARIEAITAAAGAPLALQDLYFRAAQETRLRAQGRQPRADWQPPSPQDRLAIAEYILRLIDRFGGEREHAAVEEAVRRALPDGAPQFNAVIWLLRDLALIVDADKRLRLTPLGQVVAASGSPIGFIGGVARLIRDLITVDADDETLGALTELDLLLLWHLAEATRFKRTSSALAEEVDQAIRALSARERPALWSWIGGDARQSRAGELLGSLGVQRPGKYRIGAEAWAREYAYLATWHALLLAERLRGTSAAELGKRHKIARLAAEEARWREAVRWGLSGIMAVITPATLADHLDELGANDDRRERIGRILERIRERIAMLGERLSTPGARAAAS
jgi:helicase